tara:strand:+ start:1853 stop:2416 length:564 start_codon:yes stop_codon:yes gene_type:complete
MGRPSSFRDETVFAAVARSLVVQGEVRIQTVTQLAGVSTGSIYHRFGSREGLMAASWLDAIEGFQACFLAALDRRDAVAGLPAALATPRFCRSDRERALILTCGRTAEMMPDKAPPELHARLASAQELGRDAIAGFATRQALPLERVRLALIGIPLGAVRLYLPEQLVPDSVDADIARASGALLQSI